ALRAVEVDVLVHGHRLAPAEIAVFAALAVRAEESRRRPGGGRRRLLNELRTLPRVASFDRSSLGVARKTGTGSHPEPAPRCAGVSFGQRQSGGRSDSFDGRTNAGISLSAHERSFDSHSEMSREIGERIAAT